MDISVIIPMYNGEKFIDRIIIDLNNQLFKNFEVIFIDDGSIDNSYDIIQNKINNNLLNFTVKLFHQKNKGVSAARNLGISKAEGKYYCFVDIDDGIKSEYLSNMFSVMEKENADVVFCKTTEQKINTDKEYIILNKNEALEKYLFHKFTSGVCFIMVNSKIIKQNNMIFAEGYKYSEDLHMIWRILAYSDKIILLEQGLYIYYKNQNSAMTKFNDDRFDSIILFKNLEEFFYENNRKFYPLFKKYAVAHKEWSLLWQAAYHLSWREFENLTKKYDFDTGLKKLSSFPIKYVQLSSKIYLISKKLFFIGITACLKSKGTLI